MYNRCVSATSFFNRKKIIPAFQIHTRMPCYYAFCYEHPVYMSYSPPLLQQHPVCAYSLHSYSHSAVFPLFRASVNDRETMSNVSHLVYSSFCHSARQQSVHHAQKDDCVFESTALSTTLKRYSRTRENNEHDNCLRGSSEYNRLLEHENFIRNI